MGKETNNTIQTFWVILGNFSAFSFVMISSMLLSRYFNKEDYGTYKQVMYVYSTLLVVFTLGLPRAYGYFLPRVSKEEAKDVIDKINYILMGMGLLMSSTLFFGSDLIAGFLNNSNLGISIKYFSLVPLFLLPTLGLEGILSTYKKTFLLAIYQVVTQVFVLLFVVLPVLLLKGDVNSAIIGFTMASFIKFILALYLKYNPVKEYNKTKSSITFKNVFTYTLPLMGASIWGIIISSSDQFFISRYFGNEVFADFANGSLEIPFVGMIISSTATILLPVFSKQAKENTIESKKIMIDTWRSVLTKTIKLIYPIVVFCFCFADVIMVFLYGDKYVTSGLYFQIKVIVNFFSIAAYAPLLMAVGGQKYYYNVHMYGALLLILLEWLSIVIFNSPMAVLIVSVICFIGRTFCMLFYVSNYFKIKLVDLLPLGLILKILLPAFIIIYPIRIGLDYFEINNLLVLVIGGIFYLILFGIWSILGKLDYKIIFMPLFSRLFNK